MTRSRMSVWRSLAGAGLAVAAILMVSVSAYADDWAGVASISSTMGVNGDRICVGEASRGDLGCPTYAPTVSSTGTLNITGGLVTNAVSLTTAGTTWGYLTSGASYLPVLNASSISASSLTVNGVSVTGAGASRLASLTDVSASSPANNSLLRYNTTTSKWEAVGINDGVSTTTMLPNWPDAIRCTASNTGGGMTTFFMSDVQGSQTLYRSANMGGTYMYLIYNTSTGAYSTQMNSSGDCVTNAWSISQLYANGRAFNFIGNNGTSGSASTDRITSGTTSMVAATGGTITASASLVVSGKVSSTTVQLATDASDACTAANAGMIKLVNGRPYLCRHTP